MEEGIYVNDIGCIVVLDMTGDELVDNDDVVDDVGDNELVDINAINDAVDDVGDDDDDDDNDDDKGRHDSLGDLNRDNKVDALEHEGCRNSFEDRNSNGVFSPTEPLS